MAWHCAISSSFNILFSSSFTDNQITHWKFDTSNHMPDPLQGEVWYHQQIDFGFGNASVNSTQPFGAGINFLNFSTPCI